MMRVLVTVCLLVGCTDFAAIDRGVCGNGLLEAGEDCDSSDPRCTQCSVTCASVEDCPNAGYTCGVDGLCHAPGGAVQAPRSAGTFQATDLHVTDIDADGFGDVLGTSRTSIVARYGDATGQLATLDSLITPTQTGPAAVGDLDGDGSLDVTLSTADGLVSYASTYGELAPIAVNTPMRDMAGNALDFRRFVHIAPRVIAGFIVDAATDNLYFVAVDQSPGAPSTATSLIQPCFARLGLIKSANFDADSVDVYNVSLDRDTQYDTLVMFATGTGAARRACVLAIHRASPQFLGAYPTITVADVTPTALGTPNRRLLFADLESDTDACPGLVKSDGGPNALVYFDGARSVTNDKTSACTFASTSTALPAMQAPPNAVLVGRAPIVPSVFSAATDALITNEGIYPYFPSGYLFVTSPTFTPVYKSTRNFADVAYGDFNGDGNVDVALSASAEQDVDVLYRVPAEAGFNLVRIDTTSDVTSLTVGDYDGNGLADLAYTEDLGDYERLLVSFGTPDRLLPAESAGVFSSVLGIGLVNFPDSVDYLGLADDLIVLQTPAPGSTVKRLSFLHGSPQRTLLSYFDPRTDAVKAATTFRGAVIGDFFTSGSTDYADVLAIATPKAGVTSNAVAYRIINTADGLDATMASANTVDKFSDCTGPASSSTFCVERARYVTVESASGRDVVIGMDRKGTAVLIDVSMSPPTVTTIAALASSTPANSTNQALFTTDFDGDGAAELVAAFMPATKTTAETGAVLVCALANGQPTSCEDVVPDIVSAAEQAGSPIRACFDAAAARISYRDAVVDVNPGTDLAVACQRAGGGTSVFRVRRDGDTRVVDRLFSTGADMTALRAGDVTGDGVDDVLLLGGTTVTSLIVYPQCTSRDAASCKALGEEEESP